MSNNFYTADGWIDAARLIHSPAPLVVAIGGRGIGKTYGCLKMLHDEQIPFIYLRRTQSQIDSIAIASLNPYNAVARDLGITINCKKQGKYTVGFFNQHINNDGKYEDDPEPFALGAALSTFANIRGISAENFELVLFDEFIPERHERPIKQEAAAFSNLIESLNRNRELTGKKPLKMVMLSNSNTITSDILQSIGCIPIIDRMLKRGQNFSSVKDGLIEIYRYTDSPISKRKSETSYYKILQNQDFQRMSIDNAFSESDFEYVQSKPLIEYVSLVSIAGITVYSHKADNTYYIIEGEKARNYYSDTILEKKAFRKRYPYLYFALQERRVYYSSVTAKILFEGLWNK